VTTLANFFNGIKFATVSTYYYLNTLRLKLWPLLFGAFVFIGWNGLQIVFSLNLIVSFINSFTMKNLLSTTIRYNIRTIPIYIFIILTFVIIFWLIRTFVETSFTLHIRRKKLTFKEIKAISLNFFAVNVMIVLALLFITTSAAIIHIFVKIVANGFISIHTAGITIIALRYSLVFFFISILSTTFMIDFILPVMCTGLNYKEALNLVRRYTSEHIYSIVLFYALKIGLIILSISVFQFVLRHLMLPFFLMFEFNYSFGIFLTFSEMLSIMNIMVNVTIFGIMFVSSLIIFSPIQAPLFLFQKYLLERMYSQGVMNLEL